MGLFFAIVDMNISLRRKLNLGYSSYSSIHRMRMFENVLLRRVFGSLRVEVIAWRK
jgi:hypothetical protein